MKLVKTFFVMLYVQLVAPLLSLLFVDFVGEKSQFLAVVSEIFTLVFFAFVQFLGVACAIWAIKMYLNSEKEDLSKAWILLKIKTIPFYLINFVICFVVGISLTVATAGLLVIINIIMIWYTCAFIVQSGFFGAANVAFLRKEYGDRISAIHYVLQFVPVIDVVSTLIVRKKVKTLD